ncbi:MAG: hypothetical protein A2038_00120 [Deltaproteobacteria bacterium GWA2_57_13]|nr:MAG: hypothetical protein A2038_00120 [Deltaproteobacteria bacterium GWA2_57_13]OGQ80331.1 MAG: hypothetical protein A3G40_00335 [Deltaproteobacteria bacterium RIFCSPLOWO2_12_FULL_57_22]
MQFFQPFSLWLHVCSLVVWIGAMGFFLFVFAPAVHDLAPGSGVQALNKGRKSFETISWIVITLVLITGLFNLIVRGMEVRFHFGYGYDLVLAIKVLLFLAMLFHSSLQVFKYGPKIASLTVQTAQDTPSWPEPLSSHWKRWFILLKINAALGPVVILLGLGLARG